MSDENRWREQRGLDADTQRLQSRPRLEAELGSEQTADLGVRVERVGLATGAVQREHQLLPRAIAIGMLRDDRLCREPARLPRFAARQCVLRRRSAPACGVRRRAHAPHRAST
jgi:hypothetical protein